MSTAVHDIIAKLWNLCNVLKDGGVTYHEYVIELTYLLFLKMAKETATESQLPDGYRWDDLKEKDASERLGFYKKLLSHLGSHSSIVVKEIFADAHSEIKKPPILSTLVTEIDKLDWYSARKEGLGDVYEGLLEKMLTKRSQVQGSILHPVP
jgi:type I restriction enzyme M protein